MTEEAKRYIDHIKQILERSKNYMALEAIEKLEKENEQLECDLYNTNANLQHITIEYENEISELKKENKIKEEIIIGEQQEINELKKQLDCYKSLDSHYEEIEEDAKAIAKENEELLESCKDKDRQLNKWFLSYNDVMKENEELKEKLEELQQAYTITVDKSVIREQELEAQIEQLSNDNHVLKTSFVMQQEQIEKIKLESDEHLKIVHKQLESLLKYAKDKGIVKSWFYNGNYHWELAE